ncbi:unnamed protein product [Darwinula stevensoni]|uniref:ETS domain-containing protein n=1 Tax=Darwinula stevensoni TaxID=69355 RepID=A0A7R9ABU3_9CRUS|nr:unnamed protein product [Darwinula stevensoni]CAG0899747.1 unnamed protein product [Darwinula stevensoni]
MNNEEEENERGGGGGGGGGGRGGSHIHLWQFLKELLTDQTHYGSCIRWLDRGKGVFKIEDSVRVARLWGKRKKRPAMNYDKLSRSIRQYYKKGIMKKTERSQRLIDSKRPGIIVLHKVKKRNCEIVRALTGLGVSKHLVSKTIKRYKETLGYDRQRSGRSCTAVTSRNITIVRERLRRNPRRLGQKCRPNIAQSLTETMKIPLRKL